MSIKTEFDLNLELEEVIKRIEGLNLTVDNIQSRSASIPTSFVVSEQSSEHFSYTKQASKIQKKKSNMAFRVGGRGGS